jgi:hypothetical protein
MMYMNEKIDSFDDYSNDTWSLLYVEDILKKLDIVFARNVRIYWCLTNNSIIEALKHLNICSIIWWR